ncbi:hypothetical protein, partial [Agrobacterium tumefaciens]|uniref:hypothetical protein n=1 Tax=Agrobacterium tumefaciens TaxID=358 RepID=UPI003BA20BD2
MSISAQEDIDKLLQHGYVCTEVEEQVRRANTATQNKNRVRLFGNGAPARLPSVGASKKAENASNVLLPTERLAISKNRPDQTIWFETRLMTGGSRNILDLSMKSLVERGDPTNTSFDIGDPRFMRGGVEFFGLNPIITSGTKDITLNFEGVDYTGNTILFPGGTNANGTWRLQIKGVDSFEMKIT